MIGRDLIIYILENGLEDKPICDENGKLLGFLTIEEAATKFDVGMATVQVWVELGHLDGIVIGTEYFIPANAKDPRCIGGKDA